MDRYHEQAARTSSFTEFLAATQPELLPRISATDPPHAAPAAAITPVPQEAGTAARPAPAFEHGTTIVALTYADGVILAGDRRATTENMISKRDVRKVFRADEYSAIGAAGVWSIAVELIRLFQIELEHYEKMESRQLSLIGKANRLASLIRGNLTMAMQGLVVVPLLAGYDEETGTGRIFGYDPAGGPTEEQRFSAVGSGSIFAQGALKKLYTENMPLQDALLACVQALYDAADDDSATGGPDLYRQIFPVLATVTADGFAWVTDEDAAQYARTVVEERLRSPDGPKAPLV